MIAIFLCHSLDSGVFKENAFERLRDYLNCLDLSALSQEQQEQTNGTFTNVAGNLTPVVKANRHLEIPPTSTVVYSEYVDEDTGCFLLTPPKSKSKKVSHFQLITMFGLSLLSVLSFSVRLKLNLKFAFITFYKGSVFYDLILYVRKKKYNEYSLSFLASNKEHKTKTTVV